MDITFTESDIIEKNENILIHLFFNLLDFDMRHGLFSDKSSIHDMGTCGFTDYDYEILAKQYYETCPENYTYSQGQKFYLNLSNDRFDNMILEKFEHTYGFSIDKKLHLLKDFIILLKEEFPERDWDTENIFILKTLDNRLEKEEQLAKEDINNEQTNIVPIPIRKKLTPEEIKQGFNEYLMVKQLDMSWEDARMLAKENFDKKKLGKKFEPYVPEKQSSKNKMK